MKNVCLFLVGQVPETQFLLKRLNYYKRFIKNIYLFTFEISVKDIKNDLKKYIDDDKLFLIPSDTDRNKVNNAEEIIPYSESQPNIKFYFDNSYTVHPYSQGYKRKVLNYAYPVYKYMKNNNNKFEYCILMRNDLDQIINEEILIEIINKSNNDKIVCPSGFHNESFLKNKDIDSKNNFCLSHPCQKKHRIYFGLSTWLIGAKWDNLFDLLDINNKNTNYNYLFHDNSESWFFGTYIFKKENINSCTKNDLEKIIYKYFDFFQVYNKKIKKCISCSVIYKDITINNSKMNCYFCNNTNLYLKEKTDGKDGKLIAVIPVRKGSQRIPFKNLKKFYNTTLLEIKINQLKRIKIIDAIIVNSDWDEVIEIAKKMNVLTHKRSDYYSSSTISANEFYKHIAECTPSDYKYIMYAPPTSPLIKDSTIINMINTYFNNIEINDSIVSTSLIKSFLWKNNKPINYVLNKVPRTQDLPEIYELNHAIVINNREYWIKEGKLIGIKTILYKIDTIESIDIDNPIDFEIAEFLYSKYFNQ
jgi:CMP-N,N'-diacetyllegionaminic acid synthase